MLAHTCDDMYTCRYSPGVVDAVGIEVVVVVDVVVVVVVVVPVEVLSKKINIFERKRKTFLKLERVPKNIDDKRNIFVFFK